MNASELLHVMCSRDLSSADIKAICKQRGFPATKASSRAVFEDFFLTDTGVDKTMASLGEEEAWALRLLLLQDEPVDIMFFECLRRRATSSGWHETFTQRYQEVFKQVKSSLMRKGILLMADDEDGPSRLGTKMERWRFSFPREFECFLPPLFPSVKTCKETRSHKKDVLRQVVVGIATGAKGHPLCSDKRFTLDLSAGELTIGGREFSIKRLEQWQRACWTSSLPKSRAAAGLTSIWEDAHAVSPVKAVSHAFSLLAPDEWISPEQLSGIMKVFCRPKHPSAATVCRRGWEWGCLARQEVDGKEYYRGASRERDGHDIPRDPGVSLRVDGGGSGVLVDLQTVPYDDLELVARIGNLGVEQGRLVLSPSIIKLGNFPEQVRHHELLGWLRDHSVAFKQCLQEVKKRWGNYIVHDNLMIARVKDVSLRVGIQQLLSQPGQIVILPGDYMAFPRDLLPRVEKLVGGSGHVIKRVTSKSEG